VSRTVPDNDLKPLARWVKTQRALHKAGKILDDRKMRLESINFVWDGTQLPIKRKRRRQVEEWEKQENEQPAKKANSEDVATSKNEVSEDSKNGATKSPQESKPVSAVTEGGPVIVIVDYKPKASEAANEMESGNGNTAHGTSSPVNAVTDSAAVATTSDSHSITSFTEKPTNCNTTVRSETEENGGAGGTNNEQTPKLHFQPTNGDDLNCSTAASQTIDDVTTQTIDDVTTQTSTPLTKDVDDKPEIEANCEDEDGQESAQATNDVTTGPESYGAEGEAEETFATINAATINAESPRRESPTRRRKRDKVG
jgi:hypothetical protein